MPKISNSNFNSWIKWLKLSKVIEIEFIGHLKNTYSKVNKTIGLLRKLHNTLPRLPLLTIFKSFIRHHLDYGDVIYDQAYPVSFHQKIESVQYNSALANSGTIRGTSKEKFNMS